MLFSIFLPLLVSWIFLKLKWQRIYLTYLISGIIVLLVPVLIFVVRFLSMQNPDPSAMAFDRQSIVNLIANTGLMLFLALFFQYIFNRTMGLKKKKDQDIIQ